MSDTQWWREATFYHIYPLGYCDAPLVNDGTSDPVARLRAITEDLGRIRSLGFTAIYLGPLFESGSHGYDTWDYRKVDRRLGTDSDLANLVNTAHSLGIRVVVDGVYNHVGRGFSAFQHLRNEGPTSEYRAWFREIDFEADNRFGDGFSYRCWEGYNELVELNHDEPAVREYLIGSAELAVKRFGVDGIRLDVAYCLPFSFLDELSRRLTAIRDDFWLMGEVIHGDYASFLEPDRIHSITNYECYKGIWSSFNDRNFHEIAYSLDRLFGEAGLLRAALSEGRLPYNFADNHDVSRLASILEEREHIWPLYGLLWTMPGIPSVYYGSEYGIEATKDDGDAGLRPPWHSVGPARSAHGVTPRDERLARFIIELNRVRSASAALRTGGYRQLAVGPSHLAFARNTEGEVVVVAINADPEPAAITVPAAFCGRYDCLFSGETLAVDATDPCVEVPAHGVRILRAA